MSSKRCGWPLEATTTAAAATTCASSTADAAGTTTVTVAAYALVASARPVRLAKGTE